MINLNKPQQMAVETKSESALVIAPAGSGKTRVLISRIEHLLNSGISPTEILAFTFTRKAAGEIKDRLEKTSPEASRVQTGTMHGLALGFIYRFGSKRINNITVYSEWESDALVKDVIETTGLPLSSKAANMALNHYYQTGKMSAVNQTFVKAFFDRCRENNAITYGMLLLKLRDLIPEIAEHTHYKHILVDEAQDIDPLQWEIINAMCSKFGANKYIVGDVNQSIYEFRGAVPTYLVEHQHDFDIYHLHTNYRSDAHIVDFANKLICRNEKRIGGRMLAKDKPKNPVVIINNTDSEKTIFVYEGLRAKRPNDRIAILARNHSLLKKMSRLMNEKGIKHEYVGKKSALANSENFRRFHSFMRLLINPFDNFAFMLARKNLGISDSKFDALRIWAAEDGVSHFEMYKKLEPLSMHPIFDIDPSLSPTDHASYIKMSFPDLDPTGEVIDFIYSWAANHAGGLEEYFDWLAVMDIQDEVSNTEGAVQLMTIHAAKGLEWPIVIVAGCNDGILPSSQSIRSGDLESERRLTYVAWTRAQNLLVATCRPEKQKLKNVIKSTPISRFLIESQEKIQAPITP
jgi:DNA helicase-2/ATP-dependent DNA helicase PcrA